VEADSGSRLASQSDRDESCGNEVHSLEFPVVLSTEVELAIPARVDRVDAGKRMKWIEVKTVPLCV